MCSDQCCTPDLQFDTFNVTVIFTDCSHFCVTFGASRCLCLLFLFCCRILVRISKHASISTLGIPAPTSIIVVINTKHLYLKLNTSYIIYKVCKENCYLLCVAVN